MLTPSAVTSTPPTPPTAVILKPTATPTVALNQGTGIPATTGTIEPNCDNVYQPVVAGATWSYAGSVVGKNVNHIWNEVDTITTVGSASFLREIQLPKKTIVDTWKCTKEGLVAEMPDGGQFSAVLQGPSGGVTVKTTAVTGVTLPASLGPGDAWEQHTVLEISDQKGTTSTGELDLYFRAVGPEQVTVAAGTFNSQRFSVHADFLIHAAKDLLTTFDGAEWRAPLVGLVKRSGALAIIQGQPPAQLEFDLASYHIP